MPRPPSRHLRKCFYNNDGHTPRHAINSRRNFLSLSISLPLHFLRDACHVSLRKMIPPRIISSGNADQVTTEMSQATRHYFRDGEQREARGIRIEVYIEKDHNDFSRGAREAWSRALSSLLRARSRMEKSLEGDDDGSHARPDQQLYLP